MHEEVDSLYGILSIIEESVCACRIAVIMMLCSSIFSFKSWTSHSILISFDRMMSSFCTTLDNWLVSVSPPVEESIRQQLAL